MTFPTIKRNLVPALAAVAGVLGSCGMALASRDVAPGAARIELRRDAATVARAAAAPTTRPMSAPPASEAVNQALGGTWFGPDCGGDFTFRPDGTFEFTDLTPARETIRGAWAIRGDGGGTTTAAGLLVLTCASAADVMKLDPMRRPDQLPADCRLEFTLVTAAADALVYVTPDGRWVWHFSRSRDTGGYVTPADVQ